jgi:hypothetical protein
MARTPCFSLHPIAPATRAGIDSMGSAMNFPQKPTKLNKKYQYLHVYGFLLAFCGLTGPI